MALKLKYSDEHGVVHINMSPTRSDDRKSDISDPKFDTINSRFAQYDLFGGGCEEVGAGEPRSLFRSRYNSVEEELANTPYAFTAERSLRPHDTLDITIQRPGAPPQHAPPPPHTSHHDIEDDRFFKRPDEESLFGPPVDCDAPAFTVTQLIHAQDRYYDLSGRAAHAHRPHTQPTQPTVPAEDAFQVLQCDSGVSREDPPTVAKPVVPTTKRKKESSFAILAEAPVSRPSSPRSLPVDIRRERVSPFRGRGFREETSRHNTPKTSVSNSRASSPVRRRTNSLSRIDNMATTVTLPLPVHTLPRPHSPRNFLKENIEEIRELSELNREKHDAEAEQKRLEEEEALLKEMGLLDKSKSGSKSVIGSRTNSRSNSPIIIKITSRSNSPSAILHFENIPTDSKEFINAEDGLRKPVKHRSRLQSMSKSQPQSNDGSPKNSKIPKRQNSVSPSRPSRRDFSAPRRAVQNNLNNNQRFISNSTSSIHETIKIGSQVHDKRAISKSTQNLDISPAHIRGKPPISPGRGGPPPSNKTINTKRLSPIVGTPSKSPVDEGKPGSAKTSTKPSLMPRKPVKTAGNTPATSRLNSKQPSRSVSRDPSPEKRKTLAKPTSNSHPKPASRAPSTRTTQKPTTVPKPEPKKPINRTNSMKSLTRTPSTKNLNEKPPLKKNNSKRDLSEKAQSTSKINEVGSRKDSKDIKKTNKAKEQVKEKKDKEETKKGIDAMTDAENVNKQDNETQYDKTANEKGELVIMTKKNIVSMTTAAITSQPLEVVTTVTNQLPAALEKAREKGIFERLSSKESLVAKDDAEKHVKDTKEKVTPKEKESSKEKEATKEKEALIEKEAAKEKEVSKDKDKEKERDHKKAEPEEKERIEEKKPPKHTKHANHEKTLFTEDHIKLRPLQPPYNNPQVERAKQKIDDILKEPEVSTENILTASAKSREAKHTFRSIADRTKMEVKEAKDEVAKKLIELKDQAVKQNEKMTEEIRSEATKIVESIITPVEEPKDVPENTKTDKKEDHKKGLEPIVMVVNEKKNNVGTAAEKVNETLVKGEGEVDVQSSNVSTASVDKMTLETKAADGNLSAQRNGGFPQSTSTTPKPPARSRKDKEKSPTPESESPQDTATEPSEPHEEKTPNFCQRLINKCKAKCCTCCAKGGKEETEVKERSEEKEMEHETVEKKKGMMSKLNCFKKKVEEQTTEEIREVEAAAGKASIEYEVETKRKRKVRDMLCGCCGSKRRVSDAAASVPRNIAESMSPVAEEHGCCGRRKRPPERRDSILSDRPPTSCCNNRVCMWLRGMCRRRPEPPSSRRPSMFSKNKSLSPTLPPEDTRKKLDTSLVEHTSVMRGAIPVLPAALAYFCLICNVIVPGLGTIFSGMFCLCFGIPRFGVHDGAKHRIGSFVINLLVGCGQLFTVLFCLVGWGWSIWWGVIMIKISRKYRKLKAEAAAAEAEAAPPVTANNHTRA